MSRFEYDNKHIVCLSQRTYPTTPTQVNIWTQFAATGNPNGAKLAADGVALWPHTDRASGASPQGYKCLNIGDHLELIDLPEMERLRFWEQLEHDALNGA